MSLYNDKTKTNNFSLKLEGRDYGNDESVWEVTVDSPLLIKTNPEEFYIPAGTTMCYRGTFDESEEEAYHYIWANGLLSACKISDADAERMTVTMDELED